MREIVLTGKKYPNKVALVDDEDYDFLSQWKWHAIPSHTKLVWARTMYAIRTRSKDELDLTTGEILRHGTKVRMHNAIMNPPDGLEVDHEDHNGLNNQRFNLSVKTHEENMRNYPSPVVYESELQLQVKPDPDYQQHRLSERASALRETGIYGSWLKMTRMHRNQEATVCEQWWSFDGFVEDMADGWSEGLLLKRDDNERPYEPGNCRWVPRNEHKAHVRIVEYRGRSQPVSAWCRELGVDKSAFYKEKKNGLSDTEAFDLLVSRKVT